MHKDFAVRSDADASSQRIEDALLQYLDDVAFAVAYVSR